MVMNKKGQNLTLGTIILIVLGIAVLVFLIFGFSTGWNNMWDKITNIGGGKTNVDAVRTGCELACTGQSEDSYCIQKRRVNYGEKKWDEGSCKALEAANIKITPCAITCVGTVAPLTSSEPPATPTTPETPAP